MHRWDGPSSFPYVITLFSAPNYCDYYSNKASVLILEVISHITFLERQREYQIV